MATVGLRELRQGALQLVRRAAAGEEITITVSGRPTAHLVTARPPQWRAWGDVAHVFRGAVDDDWERDTDLLHGTGSPELPDL